MNAAARERVREREGKRARKSASNYDCASGGVTVSGYLAECTYIHVTYR